MKKKLFIAVVLGGSMLFAQDMKDDNPFHQTENEIAETPEVTPNSGGGGNLPGDDDVPIDDYIPLLILMAAGIIAYSTYKKKSIN